MSIVLKLVRRHPLVSFFVLAYAMTWPLIPLVSLSPLWGFPAPFGPGHSSLGPSSGPYSPECVGGVFPEVRAEGVLRSSPPGSPPRAPPLLA